jgi:hypothetical protein
VHGRVESHALEVLEEVARIDARIRDRLLKRARKKGMTRQDEVIKLVEAWRGCGVNRPQASPTEGTLIPRLEGMACGGPVKRLRPLHRFGRPNSRTSADFGAVGVLPESRRNSA